MDRKKYIATGMLIAEMIALLVFLFYYEKFSIAASRVKIREYDRYRYILTAITFVMGAGLEWKNMIEIANGNIKLKPAYLLVSMVFIMGLALPYRRAMSCFGIQNVHTVKGMISYLLTTPMLRTIISIMAGVFFIRGMSGLDE